MKTQGISPKVWQPVALAVLAIVVQWVATGEFDRTELSQTLLTAGYAVIGYLAGPGELDEEDNVEVELEDEAEELPPER